MNIGKQYQPDDAFKAVARRHQSKYRAKVLQVGFQGYGNRLCDADAEGLLNYYDKLNSREVLRHRYPKYSRMRDADLLRSEHIPFNLLAPLDTNREAAIKIFSRAWNIDCSAINTIEMEFAPSPKEKYLNDGTAFDTYIETTLKDGNKHF